MNGELPEVGEWRGGARGGDKWDGIGQQEDAKRWGLVWRSGRVCDCAAHM
jgi:hypothetical protein